MVYYQKSLVVGLNRLFKVDSGGELYVKLLNLTRGVASGSNPANRGGAVYVNGNGASFYAVDSALHDNTAGTGADHVYSGASVIMNNTHLSHNNGGAAGGAYCFDALCILDGVEVHDNNANDGGGIYCYRKNCIIISSLIYNNEVAYYRGGMTDMMQTVKFIILVLITM